MQGYDRNGMCYECCGKPGEHGPGCSFGSRLTDHYAAIEIADNERRQRAKAEFESRKTSTDETH